MGSVCNICNNKIEEGFPSFILTARTPWPVHLREFDYDNICSSCIGEIGQLITIMKSNNIEVATKV